MSDPNPDEDPATQEPKPLYDDAGFLGYQPRECGEHRTVAYHCARCLDCREWCYPQLDKACRGCELPALRRELNTTRNINQSYHRILRERLAELHRTTRQRDELRKERDQLRTAVDGDPAPSDWMRVLRERDELRKLIAECSCYPSGVNPATYEGPQVVCPVHGAIAALNEVIRERDELRAELHRLVEQWRARSVDLLGRWELEANHDGLEMSGQGVAYGDVANALMAVIEP